MDTSILMGKRQGGKPCFGQRGARPAVIREPHWRDSGETSQWDVYPQMLVFSVPDSTLGFLNRAVVWCCGPTKALIKQHQVDCELLVLDLVQTQVRDRGNSLS